MKKLCHTIFLVFCVFLLVSCKQKAGQDYQAPPDPLFVKLDSNLTGVNFRNDVEDGLEYNILTYRNFYNGGGVAIGDINNDSLPDIFLTANLGESKLYLNKGNLTFEDITAGSNIKAKRGWRTGVTMADVNGDGWLDIYICNSGDIKGDSKENELYINNHNNQFTEQAAAYHLNDPGYTTHASFFDYDRDGDLDCYMLNNSFVDVRKFDLEEVRKKRDTLGGHKLLRNDGAFFTDVSEYAGISGTKIAYGLGVSVSDINGDALPDIYVSNDFYEKDYLYINQGNGKFLDELPGRIGHISSSSMGADIADINNDGFMDIITTDMLPEQESRVKTLTRFEQYHIDNMKYRYSFHYQYPQNALQLNNGDGSFAETAFMAGLAATDWSWGALSFDFENDGDKDIFISNGVYRDISDMDFSDFIANKENIKKVVEGKDRFDFRDFFPYIPSTKLPNYAYVNENKFPFVNKSFELGLGEPSFSNGVAYGDLDRDGDLDLVVNNINATCFIYKNESDKKTKNHFLKVYFKGPGKNLFGTGAIVTLYSKGVRQVIQNIPVRSFQSCVDNSIVFGLGENSRIDSLEVIWPDLKMEKLNNLSSNRGIVLDYKNANLTFTKPKSVAPFFTTANISTTFIRHRENRYVDFDKEQLLPYMNSTKGPTMCIGDVNGDKIEDIFLGSASGDTAKILINRGGSYQLMSEPAFVLDKDFEDIGSVFFDIDNDNDLDLLVASGGYQFPAGSPLLETRLYKNDGKGNFERTALTGINTEASCVVAGDFDKDGFVDLFIGGRSFSGAYGTPGRSFLLRNNKGVLLDETPENLKFPGMVTDAAFSDLNKDGYLDLLLVGEWMPVTYFINEKGKISNGSVVPNSTGLWNCITVADLDADGKDEFLLGNWGENSRFKASVEKPMELFQNDFDDNGTGEALVSYYWSDGKTHLYNSKTELTAQIPSLKRKILFYKDYAGKSPGDIVGTEKLGNSRQLKVETLSSSLLVNAGNGQFKLTPLPEGAQASVVFDFALGDINNDGKKDIIGAGNFWDIKPDIGRLDANASFLMLGKGNLQFDYINSARSGLDTKGQGRCLAMLKDGLVLAKNNDDLQYFRFNQTSNYKK